MIKMQFTWIKTRSAWQELEYNRARRAAALKEMRANMDAVNSALSSAMQNKITGIGTLAGNAALKRVQDATKAKTDETIKQIDSTQNTLNAAKSNLDKVA
ncbi:MAG: hypothetical protein K9G60_14290 [Pseudolabrys sp.]|nr:hypothetical protein [Pseudolabrys sp.]